MVFYALDCLFMHYCQLMSDVDLQLRYYLFKAMSWQRRKQKQLFDIDKKVVSKRGQELEPLLMQNWGKYSLYYISLLIMCLVKICKSKIMLFDKYVMNMLFDNIITEPWMLLTSY